MYLYIWVSYETLTKARIWDARKLQSMPVKGKGPLEINADEIAEFGKAKKGKGMLRGEWKHGKSVTAGYWDPHGRRIVSTSYDDTIRSTSILSFPYSRRLRHIRTVWDIKPEFMTKDAEFPTSRPAHQFHHNCQTVSLLL